MTDDAELLRRYAEEKSEEAFGELVRRHIDFVYGVALRQLRGNAALAEEVAQIVFTDLARKSGALSRHAVVVGWLHTATRFAVAKAIRTEARRTAREREAQLFMSIEGNDPEAAADWERLHPVLDAVLGELKERERTAILLRFFEKKPFGEVGEKLALTEHAARLCVDRALEKMHGLLARRGVTSTSAALGMALANQVSVAAPVGLAASVTGAVMAGGVAGGSSVGIAWLAFFAMNKIKVGIGAAVLLAALTPVAVELQARHTLRGEVDRARTSVASVQNENRGLLTELAKVDGTAALPNQTVEMGRLRARAALLRARPEGVVEAEMRPPGNAGRATPGAAFETMNWAVVTGDWAAFAETWNFRGETKRTADAFFAGLSPAAQQKYGTAERALAHGLIAASYPHGEAWMTAMQVYDTEIVDGPGTMRVRLWQRLGTGRELASEAELERGPGGWVAGQVGVGRIVNRLVTAELDPLTGEPRPKQK